MKLGIFLAALTLASRHVVAAPDQAKPSISDEPSEKRDTEPTNENKLEKKSDNEATSETQGTPPQQPEIATTPITNNYVDYLNNMLEPKPMVDSATQSMKEIVPQDLKKKTSNYFQEVTSEINKNISSGPLKRIITISQVPKEPNQDFREADQQKFTSQTGIEKELKEKLSQEDVVPMIMKFIPISETKIFKAPTEDISFLMNNSSISNDFQRINASKQMYPQMSPQEFIWLYNTAFGQQVPDKGEHSRIHDRPFQEDNHPGDLLGPNEKSSDAEVFKTNHQRPAQQHPRKSFTVPQQESTGHAYPWPQQPFQGNQFSWGPPQSHGNTYTWNQQQFPGKTHPWPQQQATGSSKELEHPNHDINFATISVQHHTPANIFAALAGQPGNNNRPEFYGISQTADYNNNYNPSQLTPFNPFEFVFPHSFNSQGPIRNPEGSQGTNPFDLLFPYNRFRPTPPDTPQVGYNIRYSTTDGMDPIRSSFSQTQPPFSKSSANQMLYPPTPPLRNPFSFIPPAAPFPNLNIPTWPFMFNV